MGRPPNSASKKAPNDELVDPTPKGIISIFSKFLLEQADFYRQQSKRFAQIAESLSALERKRKRRHEIDPDAPKKPDSAYILFVKEQQKKLKQEFPSLSSREIFTKIAGIWGQTTEEEKNSFSHKAEDLKNQYLKELEDYNSKRGEGMPFNESTPQFKTQSWTQTPSLPSAHSQNPYETHTPDNSAHRSLPMYQDITPSTTTPNIYDSQHLHNDDTMAREFNSNNHPFYSQDNTYNSEMERQQQQMLPEYHEIENGNDPLKSIKKRKVNAKEM